MHGSQVISNPVTYGGILVVVLLEYIYLLQHHKNMSISGAPGGGCRFGMSCSEIVRMITGIVLLRNRCVYIYVFVCVCVLAHAFLFCR